MMEKLAYGVPTTHDVPPAPRVVHLTTLDPDAFARWFAYDKHQRSLTLCQVECSWTWISRQPPTTGAICAVCLAQLLHAIAERFEEVEARLEDHIDAHLAHVYG